MDLLFLGSILFVGSLLGLTGVFDGNSTRDDTTDTPPDTPPTDTSVLGSGANDTLGASDGFVAGWGGDDDISVEGTAEAWGNAGNDSFVVEGSATAHGGAGADTVDAVTDGGSVWGDDGNDLLRTNGSDATYGGNGDDAIRSGNGGPAYGDGGNDTLVGDFGLYGGTGADGIFGYDNLYGGAANDLIVIGGYPVEGGHQNGAADGGTGDDTIWADGGDLHTANDGLTGGDGNDLFLATADGTTQTIHDYTAGKDQLGFVVAENDTINANDLTITSDTVQGFTDVTYGTSTLHLEGVTSLDPADILFVSDPTGAAGAAHIIRSADGNDSLSAGGEFSLTLHGGDGNDTVSGFFDGPAAYGDAGNDVVHSGYGGAGDDTVTGDVTSRDAHGDDGNDVLTIDGGAAYGGAGNDLIHDQGHSSEGIRSGTADGGDGNDTIIGTDSQYKYNDPIDYAGGAGDDHLAAFSHQALDAGAGNDVVISERSQMSAHGSTVTLGDGDDVLALQPFVNTDPFAWDSPYTTVTVTDFDPAHDALALIVPEADLANLNVVITQDTVGGFTEVTLHDATGDLSQTYRVEGVTTLTEADITLYADQTAANTGSDYGTLAHQVIAVHGSAGADTLNTQTSVSDRIYAGAGNEVLYGGFESILHGDDGNDTITGDHDIYGDAGNDVIEGSTGAHGGDGNDHITITGFRGESNSSGTADGGAGNDTIISADGNLNDYNSQHPLSGGTGDDQIETFTAQSLDAGAGNDTVILQRSADNFDNRADSTITLGEGDDVLALDPNADLDAYATSDTYQTVTVTDFDPAHDQLALIVPEASLSNLDVTITTDTAGGFTDVTLHTLNGDPAQTFRLTGVTSLSRADIALYADHAAVTAGTPWQQGLPPGA